MNQVNPSTRGNVANKGWTGYSANHWSDFGKGKKKKTPAGNGRQHLRGFCSNNSKGYRPINISRLLDKSHSIKLGLCTFGTQWKQNKQKYDVHIHITLKGYV